MALSKIAVRIIITKKATTQGNTAGRAPRHTATARTVAAIAKKGALMSK